MINRHLILYCAATACMGVAAAFFLQNLLFICLLVFLYLFIFFRFPLRQSILLYLLFFLFFLHTDQLNEQNKSTLIGTETEMIVRFTDAPKIDGNRLTGLVYVNDKEKVWFTYTMDHEKEKKYFVHKTITGSSFYVHGKLKTPYHSTVENGFNFSKYLKMNHAHWIFNAERMTDVANDQNGFLTKLKQFREKQIERIRHDYPEPAASFTEALLFGEQENLPPDIYENFRKLGLVHILALSGMQAGLVGSGLFYLFIRMGFTREKSFLAVACLMPVYAIFAGLSPSIVRACMMTSLYMTARSFGIELSALVSITITLSIYLWLNPYLLFQAGFQLSFLLSYGLILSSSLIEFLKSKNIPVLLSVTVICQLVSMPVVIYHFYEVSLLGFIVNLMYVPFFSFILFPASILVYAFSFSALLKPSALALLNELYLAMASVTSWTANFPISSILIGRPTWEMMLVIGICMYIFLCNWEKAVSSASIITFALLLCVLGFQCVYPTFKGEGEIAFLDIGQGDSTCIMLPERREVYLIDCGGSLSFAKEAWQKSSDPFDPGKDILVPYLKSKGIRTIDKLILTHADQDHIGGAAAILQQFNVKEVLIPFNQREAFQQTDAITTALKERIPIKEVSEGVKWKVDDNEFSILSPMSEIDDKNEASIVLKARMDAKSWLFVGDLGAEGENRLLQAGADVEADILKIGHHGSRHSTSEGFLEEVRPKVAMISAGRQNRYGHPHDEIIKKLEEKGIHIERTDLHGSIIYRFGNKKAGTFLNNPP